MNEEEKNKKVLEPKHWFYIGVLVLIAVFVITLYLIPKISPAKPKIHEVEYNYFKFRKAGPVWETQVTYDNRLLQPSFRFLPTEVENVTMEGNLAKDFGTDKIYLTFDPLTDQKEFQTLTIGVSEMGMNLVKGFEKKIAAGCTRNETEACKNRTIIQCETANESVIYFNPQGEPKVLLKGKCIELRGSGFDLLKSVDRVLYAWYKIIKQNIISPKLQHQD
ncbi:MAG TPA: hypothetical protein ENF94_00545 [Candidatus Woesearchaeota archaeon]|nr:hypothetical protein [Candidatus Woesearchaeota archaeon]